MSYILYSSIARAGGIDLFLGLESVSHEPSHPVRRRRNARSPRLRRKIGRGLIVLGRWLTAWGSRWVPQSSCTSALPDFKPAT